MHELEKDLKGMENLYGGTVFQSSFLLLEAFDTTLGGHICL